MLTPRTKSIPCAIPSPFVIPTLLLEIPLLRDTHPMRDSYPLRDTPQYPLREIHNWRDTHPLRDAHPLPDTPLAGCSSHILVSTLENPRILFMSEVCLLRSKRAYAPVASVKASL